MIIPGQLIALITFPGVIIHEMAHQYFCRRARVAILDVCYFRVGNPAGYVIHEIPAAPSQQILIGIGPFIVNTLLGAVISFAAAIPVIRLETGSALDYTMIWLGVSIAMHAFPSTGDAKGIWKAASSEQTPMLLRALAVPIVGLIYVGAIGSMIWLDVVYGGLVALALPSLLINLFA
jgi:hypothetical protein